MGAYKCSLCLSMNNFTCTAMQNRSSRGDFERASERRYATTSRCDDPTQLGYTAGVARKLIQAPAMLIRFPYQREIYGTVGPLLRLFRFALLCCSAPCHCRCGNLKLEIRANRTWPVGIELQVNEAAFRLGSVAVASFVSNSALVGCWAHTHVCFCSKRALPH